MSAIVIYSSEICSGEYSMFDLDSISEEGAILKGPLLLEEGETLELRLVRGDKSLQIQARVHKVEDNSDSMTVRFVAHHPKLAAFIKDA